MSERILIKRIKKAATQSGKPVAHLFANSQQRYPELVLFELSELLTVGINPEELTADDRPARFWAHYEVSDKLNGEGNPYKDILYLEPIDAPATSTSTDTSALLEAVRALTGEVATISAILADILATTQRLSQTRKGPRPAVAPRHRRPVPRRPGPRSTRVTGCWPKAAPPARSSPG